MLQDPTRLSERVAELGKLLFYFLTPMRQFIWKVIYERFIA